ncbi:hypothetical protein Goarm_007362, partial [Gossypium armourianum]|nr:hypothetical protein [Gossypium armourianum]
MVIVPATTGQMGVLPGHVPTIAELKPGILSVHEGNDVTKYFLSSGFALIHANSVADIIAVEAVPVDRLDPALVQKGLADFTQKLGSATTDLEKAEAQIGVDVHSAMNSAITGGVLTSGEVKNNGGSEISYCNYKIGYCSSEIRNNGVYGFKRNFNDE